MVVQKTLDNLKQGPKEDKVAVAGGIAVSVVAVLLVGWAILFFHRIQKEGQQLNFGGSAQDEFNFQNVKEAQQQLQETYSNTTDELRRIRDEAAARMAPIQINNSMQQSQGEIDPFGSSNSAP